MQFDLGRNFATDSKKELEGVWEVLDEDSGARILVARVGNKSFQKRYNAVPPVVRKRLADGGLADATTDSLICRLLADTILLDWENLADEETAIEYSSDNAFTMLKKYPDFRELVWEIANNASRYRVKSAEGNSPSSFDG